MSRNVALAFTLAVSLAGLAPANPVGAADLKVLGAGPVEHAFKELIVSFARNTGHKVEGTFSTVGVIQDKLKAGEKVDIIILSPVAMDELDKSGSLLAATRVEVGRAASGMAVRAGAPAPDISTPDALKKALLAARTVAYVDPAVGASNGIHFANLLTRLAIADEVNKKAILFRRGYEVANALADGKADIGNTSLTELTPHKGLTTLGPLPEPLGLVTPYIAAVATASPNRDAAAALVAHLTNAAGRERFKAAGL